MHLPKEKKNLFSSDSGSSIQDWSARGCECFQGREDKLMFLWSGKKNCYLSIHLQETGVQKNQKWILAATQKRTRKWPCSWVSHVWAEVKINFSHFHPHRVIESTRKAEGRQGQDPGEKISSETCQVRLRVSLLDMFVREPQRGLLWLNWD